LKITSLIARILLGLVFVVFGLNPFLKFIPMQLPPGLAGQFLTVLFQSHLVYVVAAVQVIGGLLLLVNRYVPLGLTLLGPVIVIIVCYHVLLDRQGIPLAAFVVILWFILFARYRQYFSGMFVQRAT
jgi:putative oxidoreductase